MIGFKLKILLNELKFSEQATLNSIKDRTLSDILNRFVKLELIEKVSHGVYKKT